MTFVAVLTMVLGIAAVWKRRALARESRNLSEMRKQLAQVGQLKR